MNILKTAFGRNILPMLSLSNNLNSIRNYHSLLFKIAGIVNKPINNNSNSQLPPLLTPVSILNTPICGFKFRAIVKKRCKDCYIVVKDRQKIVLCKTHKRHKQKEIVPHEKDTWIITHRTHGVIRPW